MNYHVLAGDTLVEKFSDAQIDGETIVFREALITGPIDAANLEDFWHERAKFVLAEYGKDEIVYHESVADETERLNVAVAGDEINLWFEYELFCSVNMWFCLSLLEGSEADVFRVEPATLSFEDRWSGFGRLEAADMAECYAGRHKFTDADIKLGSKLWQAYRLNDISGLRNLSGTQSQCFPHLREVVDAAIEQAVVPGILLKEIMNDGLSEFDEIFAEFSRRAGVYGYGDLQVRRLIENLTT